MHTGKAWENQRWGYLLVFLPVLLAWAGWWIFVRTGSVWGLWLSPAVVFGLVPLLDMLVGRNAENPPSSFRPPARRFYRGLTLAVVPVQLLSLAAGLWGVGRLEAPLALAGWMLSFGIQGGVVAINVAHELVHKPQALDVWGGRLLLSSVCYAGFRVEHVRGHHVWVSTPEDGASARLGQSLFAFWPRALVLNTVNAWRLEALRLKGRGRAALSMHNTLLQDALVTFLWVAFAVALGPVSLLVFFGQSLVAILLLELVNYVEHYGLERRKLADGRYEKVSVRHSWNSDFQLTNWVLLHLQRHSDHHADPRRPFELLRTHAEAPQLPAGYASMTLLALVPPLWRRVMDPRVRAYRQAQTEQ